MSGSLAITGNDFTVFTVQKPVDLNNQKAIFYNGSSNGFGLYYNGSARGHFLQGRGGTSVYNGQSSTNFEMWSSTRSGNAMRLWHDSLPQVLSDPSSGLIQFTANIQMNTPTGGMTVGSMNSNYMFNGDIAEIIVYNSVLSDVQRQGVECYLSTKYGTGNGNCYIQNNEVYSCQTNTVINTGSNTGTSVTTKTNLCLGGGALIVTAPSTVNLIGNDVSATLSTYEGTTDPVTVQDLRGNNVGWSLTATITNFSGATDASKILPIYVGNISRFTLTPGILSIYPGDMGQGLGGVNDFTGGQQATSVTDQTAAGVSNTFDLASFPVGRGAGKYQKPLTLSLDVPPYSYAQTYNAELVVSAS